MDFVIIPFVSAAVAAVTLVSGFGLGTVLMPAFALFFPIEVAIAAAGVVHLMNNLFKLALVGRWASRDVVVRFGVPAVIAAFIGAALMTVMVQTRPIHEYQFGRITAEVTWLKLVIAVLLAAFAGLELWPRYQKLAFTRSALPIGGALSGFFGGVSGMQGALRAPFLLRAGLTREQFVGTTNVISTMVDVARLLVYAAGFAWLTQARNYSTITGSRMLLLITAACLAGFLGSYLSSRFLKKITMRTIRWLVAVILFLMAIALGAGLI